MINKLLDNKSMRDLWLRADYNYSEKTALQEFIKAANYGPDRLVIWGEENGIYTLVVEDRLGRELSDVLYFSTKQELDNFLRKYNLSLGEQY